MLKILLPLFVGLSSSFQLAFADPVGDSISLLGWKSDMHVQNPPKEIKFPGMFYEKIEAMTKATHDSGLEQGRCIQFDGRYIEFSKMFSGEHTEINFQDRPGCEDQNLVGIIHTHPEFNYEEEDGAHMAVPSIIDFTNNSFKRYPLSIVAHKKFMCATFRRPSEAPLDFSDDAQLDDYQNHMADYAVNMLSQIPQEGSSITRLTRQAIANAEGKYGQILYCGKIGESLQRIAPEKAKVSERTMILATQGFMLAQYLAGNAKYTTPTYKFTPYDQAGVVKYLNKTFKGEKFDGLSPEALFRRVLKLHWDGADAYAAMGGAISIPVKSNTGRSFLFLCSDKTCQVASGKSFTGIDAKEKNNAHAFFQDTEDGYTSVLATSMAERKVYNMVNNSPNSLIYSEIYKGGDKWVGKPGSAVFTFDKGYAVGNVVSGMIVGPIKIHLKDGRVFNGDIDSDFNMTFKDQVK